MQTVLSAFYPTHEAAEAAIADLRSGGVPDAAISVIGSDGEPRAADGDRVVGSSIAGDRVVDADGDQRLSTEGGLHAMRGVLGGGALGTLLGVLAVPVVGPFAAAGAIVAAGTGFILGAGTGGIVEIMTHHGIAGDEAAFYGERLAAGGVVVSVEIGAPLEAPHVEAILKRTGGLRAAWDSAREEPAIVA